MKREPIFSIPLALLLGLIALVVVFILPQFVIMSSFLCWGYAHGIAEPEIPLARFETTAYSALGLVGLGVATFVFRAARGLVQPTTVFHAHFFTGLLLLSFCLWLTCITFPVVETPLLWDWSTKALYPAFLAPLTCLLLVPVGLLLICFGILYDA